MFTASGKRHQIPKSHNFNRKNTISIEWPNYMSSNPNLIVMDNDRKYYNKGKIKNLIKFRDKFICNQNTNYKFGMSKDSPFVNDYTEHHKLTKSILNGSQRSASPRNTKSPRSARQSRCRSPSVKSHKCLSSAVNKYDGDKMFTKLAMNSIDPEKQRLIHASLDYKKMNKVKSIINKQNRLRASVSRRYIGSKGSPRTIGQNERYNSRVSIKLNQSNSHISRKRPSKPRTALHKRRRNRLLTNNINKYDSLTAHISPYQ